MQKQVSHYSNVLSLSNQEKEGWGQALEDLRIPANIDPYEFLLGVAPKIALEFIPKSILQEAASIKYSNAAPHQIINNLPYDPCIIDTPTDGKRPLWKRTWVSEGVLIGLAKALGLEPLSYLQEKEGALAHEVVPVSGQERQLSNGGRVALGFHTDHSILPRSYRPEFLLLMGLVNLDRIPTLIAHIDDAMAQLDSLSNNLLRLPKFRVELPDSVFIWNGKKILSEWRPLLTEGINGELEFSGNLHSVKPRDKEAEFALHALVYSLEKVAREVVLEPGTLVFINNHRCLHARGTVTNKRWLQRIFCRNSIDKLLETRNSQKLPRYSFDMESFLLN